MVRPIGTSLNSGVGLLRTAGQSKDEGLAHLGALESAALAEQIRVHGFRPATLQRMKASKALGGSMSLANTCTKEITTSRTITCMDNLIARVCLVCLGGALRCKDIR